MPLDPQSVSLRPATPADVVFLFTVYASSRGDDLRELGWDEGRIGEFLRLQYEAQQRFTQSEHQRADDKIVILEDVPIGRMLVERREHEIRGIDIALLPSYRDQGIGSWLISRLQAEAAQARKPLRIQVIRFNRAIGLLKRLGFVRTSETGTHYQMEWQADG